MVKKDEVQAVKNEGQPKSHTGAHRNQQFQSSHREGQYTKGYHKNNNNWSRPAYHNNASRYNNDIIKPDETIDDIKEDIVRLEKEIELEIREIKSMKLGL